MFESEEYKQLIKAGFPTFGEFCKNPDRWRQRADHIFATADKNSTMLSKYKIEVTYKYKEWEAKTPEKIEDIIKNEGVNPMALKLVPRIIDSTNDVLTQIIEFMNEDDYEKYSERLKLQRDWKLRQLSAGIQS